MSAEKFARVKFKDANGDYKQIGSLKTGRFRPELELSLLEDGTWYNARQITFADRNGNTRTVELGRFLNCFFDEGNVNITTTKDDRDRTSTEVELDIVKTPF